MVSSPVSAKLMPPIVVDPRIRRKLYHVYIFTMWLDLLPATFLLYWCYYPGSEPYLLHSLWPTLPLWGLFLLTPLFLWVISVITVVWTALITKIHLSYLNLRHPPREGLFLRDPRDKDYLYWNKRNFARLFLYWLLYSTPIGFKRQYFTYSFFGMKIGKNSVLNHAWISPEFVSIGDNVQIGPGAAINSFMFENDKLLVAQITIGDNVLIGPQAVILPGTTIENDVSIEAGSFTQPFSLLKENHFYSGTPAKELNGR